MGVVMNKLISIDNIIEYWKNIEFLGQAEIPGQKNRRIVLIIKKQKIR